ncbi:MAG: NAD(P)-dependent glycerol-3-phosphate dehydrogenase [Clostridia bacterium]|nr:NAD(P)-dependent glycerol-3-phosphate dehydrogenase [Clostridia bacterium]
MAKITILGAGGWAMALALSAQSCGHSVTMWSPFETEVAALRENRGNERLLPGISLPDEIAVTGDLSCVAGSSITIVACPSSAVREVAKKLSAFHDFGIVVNVAKGFEKGSLLRLSQVLAEELPGTSIAVLSGPSHAEEVARKIPTSVVVASQSIAVAEIVQSMLSNDVFRIYTATDLIGVELGGALKNIIAVCAGICDGLGLGDNTKAALITRGLAEMARLGVCMGAKEYTFSGLSGIGDLVVTCTSKHSRNNRFGYLVGTGVAVEKALREVGTVEGYYAALMAHQLADKYKIQVPIIEKCYSILYEGAKIQDALPDLMLRPRRLEH